MLKEKKNTERKQKLIISVKLIAVGTVRRTDQLKRAYST
jgi:hypothetical protein